jgi:uncharacterized ferritin-like protein (DUF455 family)
MPTPDRPLRAALVRSHLLAHTTRAGSLQSRLAILHSLVHIEACAVDLAWDIIARFGQHKEYKDFLPEAFYVDFLKVAADEARHYAALKKRLVELGGRYGDLPVHDGLWDSATRTKESLEARLAVEHATHEARGLDVLPGTIEKFAGNGDEKTAALLQGQILPEEIHHCAAGVRWITFLYDLAQKSGTDGRCAGLAWAEDAMAHDTVEGWFHSLVRGHFDGLLKPPFNTEAREKAGFTPAWYMPLVES